MSHPLSLFVFIAAGICLIDVSRSQDAPSLLVRKAGSCPPLLPRRVCWAACYQDQDCPQQAKCCGTECGGQVCTRPVTLVQNPRLVKPGSCPENPGGPWYCSNTCSGDNDCRGKHKCCKNRCGARGCYLPAEVENQQ